MLSGIEGLYKISTVNLSLNGDILEVAFTKALVAALCVLGTKVILEVRDQWPYLLLVTF